MCHVCTCESWRFTSTAFLFSFSTLILERGSRMEPGASHLGSTGWQKALGFSPTPLPPLGYRCTLLHTGLHACRIYTLSTESSLTFVVFIFILYFFHSFLVAKRIGCHLKYKTWLSTWCIFLLPDGAVSAHRFISSMI